MALSILKNLNLFTKILTKRAFLQELQTNQEENSILHILKILEF